MCVCLPIFYYWRRRSQEKKTTHFSLFLFSHIYLITFSSILYWDFPFFVFRLLLLHSDTRNRQEIKEYNCQTASGFHSSSKLRPTTQVIDAVVYFFFLLSTPTSDTLGRKSKIPHPSRRFFFLSIFFSATIFFVPFLEHNNNVQPPQQQQATTDERQKLEKLAHDSRDHSKHVFPCVSSCRRSLRFRHGRLYTRTHTREGEVVVSTSKTR